MKIFEVCEQRLKERNLHNDKRYLKRYKWEKEEIIVKGKELKPSNSIIYRFFLILARTIDHRVGKSDHDEPNIPILTIEEALVVFYIKVIIVLLNIATCTLVIANIIRHW